MTQRVALGHAWQSFPAPIEIVAEIDALTSALNLSTEASKSELMQHVHLAILALPGHDPAS